MTIGVLSLLRGDKLEPDITMTGTINPDGTIGPVGGIPYKIDGVVAAHKTRMLIPTGQRNSANDAGKLVDVVAAGQRKGITVTEVGDVYDAYKAFTGKDLPRPQAGDQRGARRADVPEAEGQGRDLVRQVRQLGQRLRRPRTRRSSRTSPASSTTRRPRTRKR